MVITQPVNGLVGKNRKISGNEVLEIGSGGVNRLFFDRQHLKDKEGQDRVVNRVPGGWEFEVNPSPERPIVA